MTRYRAAGIHLVLSGLIALTLIIIMFGVWYPDKYFKLMGGSNLIYLIAGIDICLGPLLTLIVFKSGKKSLKFDLTVIALLQIAALSYGCYTMFTSRPIFTAFADGEFSVATASELEDSELKRGARPEWTSRSLSGPLLVGVVKPQDKKELKNITFLSFDMGYARFPRLFVSYESQKDIILKTVKPLSALRNIDKNNNKSIDNLLKTQNRPEKDFVFAPIRSFFADMAVILDANTAEFITIIEATPKEPIQPAPNEIKS